MKNPFYKSAAPSKLYLISRVKKQEKNKRFMDWLKKSKSKREKLSKSLKNTNDKKRGELFLYIDQLDIKIEKMNINKLRRLAVEHYNDLWSNRENYNKYATVNDDEDFLNRISLNMLRHEHEYYESEIDRMFGKVGKDEGYILLRDRIESEIFKIYPFLKQDN